MIQSSPVNTEIFNVNFIKNSNNLVAKYTLSKITERRLGDLEEILNTKINT